MTSIHPSAVIHENAIIGDGCTIGPYCVIGEHVKLGENITLHSHVCIDGHTEIGEGTEIFPFASIGHVPQDLKFHGEKTELFIGKNCTIREHVTMNPGTEGGGSVTRVGDNCLFMMASHVAHDCQVGNNVILANNATLAGHVEVGDFVVIGGLAAIHQFVRIGSYAMIGGMSGVEKDVIPFGSVMGERANLAGLNLIGLKRRDIPRESIHALRNAYKALFGDEDGTLNDRIEKVAQEFSSDEVTALLDFIRSDSSRSFCTPKQEAA